MLIRNAPSTPAVAQVYRNIRAGAEVAAIWAQAAAVTFPALYRHHLTGGRMTFRSFRFFSDPASLGQVNQINNDTIQAFQSLLRSKAMLKRSIFITLMLALCAAAVSAQQSVGSEHWFQAMRQTAANLAMMKSLTGTRDYRKLPADYVEFAGRIAFPNGNPFPKGRLPDLRIVCRDIAADGVDRAPLVGEDGGFYTVFKRGETYDLYWMYYFGSREKFASVTIRAEGPRQRRLTIEYRPGDAAVVSSEGANEQRVESGHDAEVSAVAPRAGSTLVVDPDEYDLS